MSSAELYPNAFSAVAAFFGQDDTTTKEEKEDTAIVVQSKRNTNRMGVGASDNKKNATATKGLSSSITTAKETILKIGRSRHNPDEEDDIEENDDDEEEDEEEGRTSAIQEKVIMPSSTKEIVQQVETTGKKKKKKKVGKKERLAQKKEQGKDEPLETTTNQSISKTTLPEEEQKDTHSNVEDDNQREEGEEGDGFVHNKNNKKKRKRVRSKQKNIKKDNRTFQQKPDHLKVFSGNTHYKGRPLTEETRKYFQLGESKTSQRRKGLLHNKTQNTPTMDEINDGALAIDTLGSVDNHNAHDDIDDGGELVYPEASTNESVPKKKKKSKKRKYKNL